MSYDIWVVQPPCTGCQRPEYTVGDWGACTSNLAPMWRAAGADLAEFHDKPAGECAPILRAGIEKMRAEPTRFRAMNPDNGWGDYDSLMPELDRLLALLESAPTGIVKVSR